MGKQRESTLRVQTSSVLCIHDYSLYTPMVLYMWAREASRPGIYMFYVNMALFDQLAYVLLTLLVPLGHKFVAVKNTYKPIKLYFVTVVGLTLCF